MACLFTRSNGSNPPCRSVWLVAEYSKNRPTIDSRIAMPISTQSICRIGRRSCANVRLATRSISAVRGYAARAARVADIRIKAVDHLSGDRCGGLPPEPTLFDHRDDDVVRTLGVRPHHGREP